MSKKEEINLEWRDARRLWGTSDIELDLEEYAGYIVDMQSLKKRGLQMRKYCGQKYSMRREGEWTPGIEEDVLALWDIGKGHEGILLGESPLVKAYELGHEQGLVESLWRDLKQGCCCQQSTWGKLNWLLSRGWMGEEKASALLWNDSLQLSEVGI